MSSNTNIRKMTKQDKQAVIEMMRVFYTSPAVFSNGSENIFLQDIEACTGENPYLDGYISVSYTHLTLPTILRV
mgnify:CR=1 FL=1